jgi:hypothetical protein
MAVPAGHRLREYGPWFVVVSDALWPAELHARISFRSCIGVHCWSLSSLLGRCYRERAGWIPILEASLTTDAELRHLDRCVELATEALEAGDEPFGSVLVAADGTVLAEDRNRPSPGGDSTRHPEDRAERGSYVGCIAELGVPPSPVRTLAIEDVVPGLTVQGPGAGPGRGGPRPHSPLGTTGKEDFVILLSVAVAES